MWYIQNEVVSGKWGSTDRFGVSRILRMKVQTKATEPLHEKGMNFGPRVAFDKGMCTGPDCSNDWDNYGYNVGCNKLGDWPFPQFDTHYPKGIWYSLPGKCNSRVFSARSPQCEAQEPGGRCAGGPTGAGNCTYSYEDAGQITLQELYASVKKNWREFWSEPDNEANNLKKIEAARSLFRSKYGPDLPEPSCDFDRTAFGS